MKICSLYMVVKIAYKVCTLNRESIRFGGGLVYEFRYLHHCNSYHLKSRKNGSYMMHVCILNMALTNIQKAGKIRISWIFRKKKTIFCKRRKKHYATNILKDSNVHFKMKTMFFFNFRESNFFIIYILFSLLIILKIHLYHDL